MHLRHLAPATLLAIFASPQSVDAQQQELHSLSPSSAQEETSTLSRESPLSVDYRPSIPPGIGPAALPYIAGCEGFLTQDIYNGLRVTNSDPADAAAKIISTIMASPQGGCLHQGWQIAHGIASAGAKGQSGPEPLDFFQDLSASSALLGVNYPLPWTGGPTGGEPEYQGESTIAMWPGHPMYLVAGANSWEKHLFAGGGTIVNGATINCASPDSDILVPGTSTKAGTHPLALYSSVDGGNTWSKGCAPWPAQANSSIPNGMQFKVQDAAYWQNSDPALAWDRFGNAYAAYMLENKTQYGDGRRDLVGIAIAVAKLPFGTTTWLPLGDTLAASILPEPAISATAGVAPGQTLSNGYFSDKPMMAVDQNSGKIYVIWDQDYQPARSVLGVSGRYPQEFVSTWDGSSWTTDVVDPAVDPMAPDAIDPSYALGGTDPTNSMGSITAANGTAYAVWTRLNLQIGAGSDTLMFSKKVGDHEWEPPTRVKPPGTPVAATTFDGQTYNANACNVSPAQNFRTLFHFGVIGVHGSDIYVAYQNQDSVRGDAWNVYLTRSTNGGTTWSEPKSVIDPNDPKPGWEKWTQCGGTTGVRCSDKFLPWLAIDDATGSAVVAWYDTRGDITGRKTSVYVSKCTTVAGSNAVWCGPNVNTTTNTTPSNFTNAVDYSDESRSASNPANCFSGGNNTKANQNQYGDYMGLAAYGDVAYVLSTDSRNFFPIDSSKLEDLSFTKINLAPAPAVAPTIISFTPTQGSIAGGTRLEIMGTNFVSPVSVSVGGNPATNVVWNSSTRISATTGPHVWVPDPVNVVVTNQDLQSATLGGYTYTLPTYGCTYGVSATPTTMVANTSLSVPIALTNTGSLTWPANGTVKLSYHWKQGATVITFEGNRTLLTVPVSTSRQITVNADLHTPNAPGTYTLQWDMVNEGVTWFSWAGVPPAEVTVTIVGTTVTAANPTSGPAAGSDTITISGTNFQPGATTVAFGGVALPASSVNVLSTTSLTVLTPPHASGPVDIVVTSNGTSGTLAAGYKFVDLSVDGSFKFYPIAPCRLVDTRSNAPAVYSGPPAIPNGGRREFVAWNKCGIPTTAQALAINATSLNSAAIGWLRVFPSGLTDVPVANVVDARPGRVRASRNDVFLNSSTGSFGVAGINTSADAIVDVFGYFAPPDAGEPVGAVVAEGYRFTPIVPCRIVDTRTSTIPNFASPNGPPQLTSTPRAFEIRGHCGIPRDAQAVSVTLTVRDPVAPGFVAVWPTPDSYPGTSNINYSGGEVNLANGTTVMLGADTTVPDFFAVAGVTNVDFLIDVFGYYK